MQSWRAVGDAVTADSDDRRYRYGLLLYAFGDAASRAQAEHWLRRAAANGHIAAQYSLGVLLHERGTQAQIAEAAQWWRAAAHAGHASAQFNLGVVLYCRGNPEAERWWRAAAQAGHAGAQYNLGALLDERGTAASTTEAERWWRAAAQAGDPDAQHSLAALLDDRGTAASTTEATRWREAAAGLTSVQRHLGALSDRRARVGASDAPAGTQSAAAAKQRGPDREWMSDQPEISAALPGPVVDGQHTMQEATDIDLEQLRGR